MEVAKVIKERYRFQVINKRKILYYYFLPYLLTAIIYSPSYVCSDLAKEFQKFDEERSKYIKQYDGQHSVTKKVIIIIAIINIITIIIIKAVCSGGWV
jgi:hypothetical protein